METDTTMSVDFEDTSVFSSDIIGAPVEDDWLTTDAPVCDNYSECESCQ